MSLHERQARVLIMAAGRAATECLVDIRSAASARIWMYGLECGSGVSAAPGTATRQEGLCAS